MSVYFEFAANFNQTPWVNELMSFNYTDKPTKSTLFTTSNGTRLETCVLDRALEIFVTDDRGYLNRNTGQYQSEQTREEIWPLSVFERRYRGEHFREGGVVDFNCPHFDVDLAKQLLINTTISALSLNKNIDTVVGTVTRAFNMYHFRNKLAFFLPYSLCVGLAVPIIVLGLIAFYTMNNKMSPITGDFLQLLMTMAGPTQLENLVMGSATMGGHENVTDELKAAEIMFGELIGGDNDEMAGKIVVHNSRGNASTQEEGALHIALLNSAEQDRGEYVALDVEMRKENEASGVNAGFGLAEEVTRLRRRNIK